MIRFLQRNEVNEDAYNDCISKSIQSQIYAFSWYLDVVANTWGVLVLDDYKAVMPIPFRKKYGIKYVYPPLWTLQLGVFGKGDIHLFIKEVEKHFSFIELRLHPGNILSETNQYKTNEKQILKINTNFDTSEFRKDRKKDLKKANQQNLVFKKSTNPRTFIELFKNNVGKRTQNIKDKDYTILKNLCEVLQEKRVGELFEVYDKDIMIAGAFILKHQQKATILFSATDFNNRDNGSNTFLITKIIETYKEEILEFDFGGSSMPSIAKYFKSFGAETITYPFLKINRLPFPFRLFKS